MTSRILLTTLLLAASALARADPSLQAFLEQTLVDARDRHHLPAVAALVQVDGRIVAEAAIGVRALGHPEPVTLGDRWHIGSDTKAFTATLVARLVERGVMSFDDTLAASFPAFAADIHPAYRNITVAQLLSHTAGLPTLTDDKDLPVFEAMLRSARGLQAQRAAVARGYLRLPPASAAGEFAYSNVGYIIAGAIAEARTGRSWEDLLFEQVFRPLGIRDAGFGAPGTAGRIDQPRGHQQRSGRLVPLEPGDAAGDNPPALGPAGTINITLHGWLMFAQDQLDGVRGRGRLLKAGTYRRLHTPVTGNYAFGWGVKLEPNGTPSLLTHSGSNGYWLADVRIMPRHDTIFLVVMNSGDEAANTALRDIVKPLQERLKPFD